MNNTRFVVLRPTLTLLFIAAALLPAFAQTRGVLTQQYDNGRSGQNRYEMVLKPSNVNSATFGKIFSFTVDGQLYAQPLYVYKLNIPGQGIHNVLYLATQMDSLFAIDADTGATLWQDSFIDLSQNIEPVPCSTDQGTDISCGVYPYYGITSTPVIDASTNTMYLVARTWNLVTQTGYQWLHAVDITTGVEKFGGPIQIQGSVPGTGSGSQGGTIYFNPLADIQRSGLLLLNQNGQKTVYIGWAGAEHGWIMGYNASTLAQTAIFATTPNAVRGGVWHSGNGLVADSSGYIYASTGDALFDANTGGTDYGDSLIKFDSSLNVVDYFTPMDQNCRYMNDYDLASSGPMILPSQAGNYPHEIMTSGKGGNPCDSSGFSPIYVVNRDNMGKFSPTSDNVIQEISGAAGGYWSSAASFTAGTQTGIYYAGTTAGGGSGDNLKMFIQKNELLSTSPASQTSNIFPIGATPSVSSNATRNPIVWAIMRSDSLSIQPGQVPAVLYAFDATNVANLLYSSSQNVPRDQGGCGNKFAVPTVANGKVYVGTQNEVDVFGLLPTGSAPLASLASPCYSYGKQTVGTTSGKRFETITNVGKSTLTFGTTSFVGLNSSDFTIVANNCTGSLAPNASCTLTLTFTPSAKGPRIGQLLINDNAAGSPHNVALNGVGQ